MAKVHQSKQGIYHPAPDSEVAWTVNDTRGYVDEGVTCDECGACGCEEPSPLHSQDAEEACAGLSFAFVCLDGGEALCEDCAATEVEIVDCNCPSASEALKGE